jgi:hypothetical protein
LSRVAPAGARVAARSPASRTSRTQPTTRSRSCMSASSPYAPARGRQSARASSAATCTATSLVDAPLRPRRAPDRHAPAAAVPAWHESRPRGKRQRTAVGMAARAPPPHVVRARAAMGDGGGGNRAARAAAEPVRQPDPQLLRARPCSARRPQASRRKSADGAPKLTRRRGELEWYSPVLHGSLDWESVPRRGRRMRPGSRRPAHCGSGRHAGCRQPRITTRRVALGACRRSDAQPHRGCPGPRRRSFCRRGGHTATIEVAFLERDPLRRPKPGRGREDDRRPVARPDRLRKRL